MNLCVGSNSIVWFGLTWTGAVMCSGVPDEARSTEMTLVPGGVVDAAEAAAGVGVTELGGVLRVCIATAVTWNTHPRCFVEAGATLVTLWASVPGKALVTHWGATGICTGRDKDTHQIHKTNTTMTCSFVFICSMNVVVKSLSLDRFAPNGKAQIIKYILRYSCEITISLIVPDYSLDYDYPYLKYTSQNSPLKA